MEQNILEKKKSLIGCTQGPITNHYQHLELQTRGNNIIQTESDMDITTSVQIRQDILAMQCNAKLGVLLYFHSLPFVVSGWNQSSSERSVKISPIILNFLKAFMSKMMASLSN